MDSLWRFMLGELAAKLGGEARHFVMLGVIDPLGQSGDLCMCGEFPEGVYVCRVQTLGLARTGWLWRKGWRFPRRGIEDTRIHSMDVIPMPACGGVVAALGVEEEVAAVQQLLATTSRRRIRKILSSYRTMFDGGGRDLIVDLTEFEGSWTLGTPDERNPFDDLAEAASRRISEMLKEGISKREAGTPGLDG